MNMSCEQIEECIGAYLADHLTVQERYRVEMHLDGCATCQAEYDSLGDVAAMLQNDFDAEDTDLGLDTSRREALSRMFADANPVRDRKTRVLFRRLRTASASVAVAASLLVGAYFGSISGQQQVQPTEYTLEITSVPRSITMASNLPEEKPTENHRVRSLSNVPYPDFVGIVRYHMPEYGMGTIVQASSMGGSRIPYVGLPTPRHDYDFSKSPLASE
jgi:hypothetical protein